MARRFIHSFVLVGCLVIAAAACGDGSADPDARTVDLFDAPPADASVPDAFVCVENEMRKMCGPGRAGCVDITMDPLNCGGCGIECPSPGQACVAGSGDSDAGVSNDVAHCECPPTDFVPETIEGFDLSQFGIDPVNQIPGGTDYIAFGLFTGEGFSTHAFTVTFAMDQETGTDIDLSMVTGTVPVFGVGYNVDVQSQSVQTPYAATSGTLNFEYACATGVKATVTNAMMVEVEASQNPTPVANGCSFFLPTATVSVGDDCTPDDMDGGVGDDGGMMN